MISSTITTAYTQNVYADYKPEKTQTYKELQTNLELLTQKNHQLQATLHQTSASLHTLEQLIKD